MSDYDNIEDYEPLFELGLYKKDNPCCRVIPIQASIDPIALASLAIALFETAMQAVPDSNQIEFEDMFRKALTIMFEERFEYDLVKKYPSEDE